MVKHMSSREARANFADLLGSVFSTNETVIVEKKGKPVAVVISPVAYEALTEASARLGRDRGVAGDNADHDPDAVLADATAIVETVRTERHRGE